ncbi:MAG: hypothetical protein UY07_C0019G0005 [Parcubacteria group bacterium GW2011_GWA1_47_8]|nr:MAG: hypothetical protein UY07_C0019G0005 [Parcubacteria group bacterium GW2011_GWA1_47_8]KKW07561.1 MAG: hypothetical protein UY42_C0010G0006 [Parcubacteria group bacterium GW2011_GWA2_49_16]
MTAIITLFYLSLATIVLVVGRKLLSVRTLKLSLIEGVEKELHGKLYDTLHHLWGVFLDKCYVPVRKLSLAIFYTVAHEVLHAGLVVGQKVKVRHGKWYNMVKGKGVIRKKGSVSFFLRDVAEYKKQLTTDH